MEHEAAIDALEIAAPSEARTREAGARLAETLRKASDEPAFVQLEGTLGAGKTEFARGFIRRWAELRGGPVPQVIASPTYNIVRIYEAGSASIAHMDLYRIRDFAELEAIGFEQYFYGVGVCLVEWLERVPEALAARPPGAIVVRIAIGKASARRIRIEGLRKPSWPS